MIKYGFLEKWRCVKCGASFEANPAAVRHEMEKAAAYQDDNNKHDHQWEKLDEENSDIRSDSGSGPENV